MFKTYYNVIPSSENGQSHRRQRSAQLIWRVFRQRQTVIRRIPLFIIVVVLLCSGSLRLFRTKPWSSVPMAPSTPFILKGLPSSHKKLTDALDLAATFPPPHYRPACAPISSIIPRYASLSASESNTTIYLALNLLDAQSVLPTFIHELPVLLTFMGSHRFHVSILENGSTDLTAGLLVVLARALAAVGSSYEIVVRGEGMKSNKGNGRRIVELARLRNDVLQSLFNGQATKQLGIKQFDMVLFMNDIFWCASDMLEIIKQHVVQESHMTCATDWGSNVVYDRWVARTMSGQPFYAQETLLDYFNGPNAYSSPFPNPLPYDDHDRKQFKNLHPLQVFSCWNGAAVIDPHAFFKTPSDNSNGARRPRSADAPDIPIDKVEKHTQYPSDSNSNSDGGTHAQEVDASIARIRFRTARNDASPITEKASECFLICVDLWRKGMGRILLVPRASVAYDLWQYESVRQDGGRTVPHPIGIGHPVTYSGTVQTDGDAVDDNKSVAIDDVKVPWSSTPPANVVYHDHAWWHEKERWGPWDEA